MFFIFRSRNYVSILQEDRVRFFLREKSLTVALTICGRAFRCTCGDFLWFYYGLFGISYSFCTYPADTRGCF